MVIEFCSGFGG